VNISGYANKKYFMLQHFFKNTNISKKLKLIPNNTTIHKQHNNTQTTQQYTKASEIWTLTNGDIKQLNILKGKFIEEFLTQYMAMNKENWRILTH
jgi:hypothetical protein